MGSVSGPCWDGATFPLPARRYARRRWACGRSLGASSSPKSLHHEAGEFFFGVCAVCPEPCHQDNPVFLVFVARNSLKTILAPLKSHFRVFLNHLLPFIGVILCHTVPPSVLCLVPIQFDVPRVSPVPVPPVGFVLTPYPPTGPNAVSVLFQVDTQRDGEEQVSAGSSPGPKFEQIPSL